MGRNRRLLIKKNANRPDPFVKKTVSTRATATQHTGQGETANELGRQCNYGRVSGALAQQSEEISDDTIKITPRATFSGTKRCSQLWICTGHRPQLQFGQISRLRECIGKNAGSAIDRVDVFGLRSQRLTRSTLVATHELINGGCEQLRVSRKMVKKRTTAHFRALLNCNCCGRCRSILDKRCNCCIKDALMRGLVLRCADGKTGFWFLRHALQFHVFYSHI